MTEQGGQDGVEKGQTGSLTECFNTNGLWPGGDAAHISRHQLLVKEVVRVAVFTIFGIKLPKYVLAPNGHQVYATVWNPQRSPELGQLAERDNLPITSLPMDVDSDESVKPS